MEESQKEVRGSVSFKRSRGQKRKDLDGITQSESIDETSPVLKAFKSFQIELDARYDKYERLVKCSRDVTIHSKRIIFHLHRATSESNKGDILTRAEKDLKYVENTLLKTIAEELINEDFYCFLRAYSPGLQEYIEALSFYHFIKERNLITLQKLQEQLVFKDNESDKECDEKKSKRPLEYMLVIPPLEYMLGLADLTGELMRRCINCVGLGNMEEPFIVCKFLQDMYDGFLSFGNLGGRELTRKTYVLHQSLRKVENACYMIRVRGSEMPNHMLEDMFADVGEN